MTPRTADGQQATYSLRRQGKGLRRRYVVMLIGPDGALEWEWEPIRKGAVVSRLARDGEHTTEIFDLIHAADDARAATD